jgi:hypothetical protein
MVDRVALDLDVALVVAVADEAEVARVDARADDVVVREGHARESRDAPEVGEEALRDVAPAVAVVEEQRAHARDRLVVRVVARERFVGLADAVGQEVVDADAVVGVEHEDDGAIGVGLDDLRRRHAAEGLAQYPTGRCRQGGRGSSP